MPPPPSGPAPQALRDRGAVMQINVTFRHVEPTSALRAYAEETRERVKKYLRRPVDAHVILSAANERHVAEITLQADHVTMFAKEETHDLYSAIDLALDKLEHQAQKLKARRRDHKGPPGNRGVEETEVRTSVLAAEPPGPGTERRKIRTQRVPAKPLPLQGAVVQSDLSGDEFLV